MPPADSDNPRRRLMARMSTTPREPNWAEWKQCVTAPLWEAVAISCRIEPSEVRGWRIGISKKQPPEQFETRLRFVESLLDVNGGNLKCKMEGDQSYTARIELGDFRAWLEYEGIQLPSEFPTLPATNPPKDSSEQRKSRLTLRIATVRKTRKDFMAAVACEEGISIQRLQQIVGTTLERTQLLQKINGK